ncbi:MAG: hypothetical protein KIT60_20375 [Burkholderiaceae bacterium]|nr:hypothetical protein [Burkholderiaceae bacterium]
MKKLLTTLVGAVALSTMLPAFAGPDWQVIEQARKNRSAQVAQKDRPISAEKCAMRTALALDHGPRATTTPYLNEQRRGRVPADTRAC